MEKKKHNGCEGCKHELLSTNEEPCCYCRFGKKIDGDDMYTPVSTPRPKEDLVNHPSHYADTCSLECIEVMEYIYGPLDLSIFCRCNAFKYLWRFKNKGGAQDLEKAKWYLKKAESLGYEDQELVKLLNTVAKRLSDG